MEIGALVQLIIIDNPVKIWKKHFNSVRSRCKILGCEEYRANNDELCPLHRNLRCKDIDTTLLDYEVLP